MKTTILLFTALLITSCGGSGGSGGGGSKTCKSSNSLCRAGSDFVKPKLSLKVSKDDLISDIDSSLDTLADIKLGKTFTKVFKCSYNYQGYKGESLRVLEYAVIEYEKSTGYIKMKVERELNDDDSGCFSELITEDRKYYVITYLPKPDTVRFYLDSYTDFYTSNNNYGIMTTQYTEDGYNNLDEFGFRLDKELLGNYYYQFTTKNSKDSFMMQAFHLDGHVSSFDMSTEVLKELNEDFFVVR